MTFRFAACFLLLAGIARSDDDFGHALGLYQHRSFSAARVEFQRLDAAGRNRPEVWFYLGRVALWFDDVETGKSYLEKAAAVEPTNARVRNALGDAYGLAAEKASVFAKLTWASRCRSSYEEAVRLAPNNPDFRWSLLAYYSLAPALLGGSMNRAFAEADTIRRLDPMSGRVAYATLYLTEHKPDLAFRQFEAVLQTQPDDFLALYQIGRCAAVSGKRLDQGWAALSRCLTLPAPVGDGKPDYANVHYRRGNILDEKGDHAAAKAEYAAAYALESDFRPAKVLLKN